MVQLSAAKTGIGVGVLVLILLVGLWSLRHLVGLFIRVAELIGIVAVAVLLIYVVYELVRGWQRAE